MTDEITEEVPFQQRIVISQEMGGLEHPPPDRRSERSPPACEQRYCTDQFSVHYENSKMDDNLRPIEQRLQCLLNKADEFQTLLLYRGDQVQRVGLAQEMPAFLCACQPFFTYVESTARSTMSQHTPLPLYIRTQLLQFSEQLCTRLEQLMLVFASLNLLSLEEEDPLSISHFYVGQCELNTVKVSIFRYCCPTPFLARVRPGSGGNLYKRMRWNVERQGERLKETERQQDEQTGRDKGDSEDAEFYFLCCEDTPERYRKKEPEDHMVRMWSIGQWVQTDPDPVNADIVDWILCTAPQGQYKLLLHLGPEEPSACTATDYLLGVLISMKEPGDSCMALGGAAHA